MSGKLFDLWGKFFNLQGKFCEVCGEINIACGNAYMLLFPYEIDHSDSDAEFLRRFLSFMMLLLMQLIQPISIFLVCVCASEVLKKNNILRR